MGGAYYIASAGLYNGYYAAYDECYLQLLWRHEYALLPRQRSHHRLHGRRIKQRINKLQTNDRRRLNSSNNNCR